MNDFAEKERLLENALEKSDTKEALQILFELAEAHARKKDFAKAEQYRDRLYDVDPSALTHIIHINEIIEEEKTEGINPNHRNLFAGLYDHLTTEEGNALFYAFEEISVSANEVVYNQGDSSHALFFVNQGKLRVENQLEDQKLFIKYMSPGTFFGSNSFFSSSICTSSVIAVTTSTLYKLDKEAFKRLKAEHPGLDARLKSFCINAGTVSTHIQEKKMDRRGRTREKVFGNAAIQLLTSAGTLIGKPIRVGLHDISSGGTSFLLRLTNDEKADIMLGRKLVIQFSSKTAAPLFKIQKKGAIVAICPNPFDDYSFHLKFDSPLPPQDLDTIRSAFSKRPAASDKA